ncbi:MAG: hypothetical protein ACREVZ_01285 [Burkholderiales bacterium]
MKILLGYELGTGKPVEIPLTHLAVTGQTQASGKTTTLEALISRSGLRAVAFVTKRGEGSFTEAHPLAPYFRERADWQFVKSLLESQAHSRMNFEAAWIIRACKGARTLADVQKAVQETMRTTRRSLDQNVCEVLNAYFDAVLPQIARLPYTKTLALSAGINVMNLADYSGELQALVIRSVLEWVYEKEDNTIVIIPEAWEFIPQKHGSPVMDAAIALSRKGGAMKNYVWLDSQDIAGVNKEMLRAPQVWILGVQREVNEVKRTLAHIPIETPKPKAADVMQLGKGEFFVSFERELRRVYVQPAWLPAADAVAIARGQIGKSFANLRRAASTAGATHEEKEEAMWKERYLELEARFKALENESKTLFGEQLKLAAEVQRLTSALMAKASSGTSAVAADATRGRTAGAADRPRPGTTSAASAGNVEQRALPANGAVDLPAIYAYVKQRAAADPGILELLTERPELRVKLARQVVQIDGSSFYGRMAQLVNEGFFKAARPYGAATDEAIRRGWCSPKTPKIRSAEYLDKLSGMGFLTRETDGYQAVAGMKVNIE